MYSILKSCLLLLIASLTFAKNTPKTPPEKSASPIVNGNIVSSAATFPYQVLIIGCGLRIFPNPANDVVSFEFENPEMLESIPDLIEIQDEKSHKIVKSSNVKAIKDRNRGNPKAYERIDFEVADLPRGTYYVQITFDQRKEKDKTAYRIILTD